MRKDAKKYTESEYRITQTEWFERGKREGREQLLHEIHAVLQITLPEEPSSP